MPYHCTGRFCTTECVCLPSERANPQCVECERDAEIIDDGQPVCGAHWCERHGIDVSGEATNNAH